MIASFLHNPEYGWRTIEKLNDIDNNSDIPWILATSLFADPTSGFVQTTLVTSATDPDLVNPWGISSSSTGPFWVSDNGSGKATLYNSAGTKQGLVVSMPTGAASITGQVFNGTSSFNGDLFLFASEDGAIDGWRGALGTSAEQLFSVAGADYKGLAFTNDKSTLFAANFTAGRIDEVSSSGLLASFSDPNMPAGYAPFQHREHRRSVLRHLRETGHRRR